MRCKIVCSQLMSEKAIGSYFYREMNFAVFLLTICSGKSLRRTQGLMRILKFVTKYFDENSFFLQTYQMNSN